MLVVQITQMLTYVVFLRMALGAHSAEAHINIFETNCSTLQMGQFICPSPDIDPLTQEPKGCNQNNVAYSKYCTL